MKGINTKTFANKKSNSCTKKLNIPSNDIDYKLVFIIFVGILVRVLEFGNMPYGFNQDEAFAGYEAFSLLKYGVDSHGYPNPCYFVSWGSGMNVLESYLAIPFMALFGCSVITLRLPQLILACISIPVFYLLLKRVFGRTTALWGTAILAVCPWHIMLSRWGLESNLAPSLLLIGLYFLLLGTDNSKFFVLSAVFYGIALYSYAITWVIVPLTIFLCGYYLLIIDRKIQIKYVLIACFVLLLFAAPLILFLLVNKNIIPEIVTPFLSVPKMLEMRAAEISLKNLISPNAYYNFFNIFINQTDNLIWNSTDQFGMFYKISLPFIFIGIAVLVTKAIKSIKDKCFSYDMFVLLAAISSFLGCVAISNLNINKSNSFHFYTLIFLCVGINQTVKLFSNPNLVKKAIVCAYTVMFVFFCSFYFGNYQNTIASDFRYGVGEAIEYAKEQQFELVYVDSSVYHSQVLFFDQTPNDVYRSTVKYNNYPSAYLNAKEFSNYVFTSNYSVLDKTGAYIIRSDMANTFESNGYNVKYFDNYAVAVYNG
ncbi:MAG: glycosyltransferase family 39 protein [Ruminococcaceae bacterium]|nr:glycosyltransferase family 39 protein [Oscillospiraceae bacterium]